MRQLKILKEATISADAAPTPGVIVLPASVHAETLVQIILAPGFDAVLAAREVDDVAKPSLPVVDDPALSAQPVVLWTGRAGGAPLYLYASAPTSVTYTVVMMGAD